MATSDLAGKAVLITGASSGIGAAAAAGFAEAGARVAIHYHLNRANAEELAEQIIVSGGEAKIIQGDLGAPADVKRVIADVVGEFGRIDVLVNNAGGMVARRNTAEADDAFLKSLLDLNVCSVVMMCREAIPVFRKQGGGNIINVSSSTAKGSGGPGMTLYSSAKGFILTFTKCLAKELAKDNIRVNAVSPGLMQTPAHERLSTPAHLEAFAKVVPLGRIGQPSDCVGAFLYLASDLQSGYVSGNVIDVTGGH